MSVATMDSFLEVLKKSGLISESRLQAQLMEWEATSNPATQPAELRGLVQKLIDSGDITLWQAEKLLSGKHKGFFLGKYKLLRLLGRGGMSAVYLAEHILMKRHCAIKVLPTNRVNDSSYLGRFHLEAQAAAVLDDPNIVRAYDVDHFVDGKAEVHFLVMEYVEGQNLHDLLIKNGPLPPLDAAEFIRQAANGLAHAHAVGLVHRDIKPGNLLLDLKGTVKILDRGLARFFDESDDDSLTIQHDERVLGTADFLAPEQAINSHNVDSRADIYSLGCTLYFLLTKHAPFEQGSLAQRLMAHQTQTPPPVSQHQPEVPASLIAIVEKMMAKKADDRYQTADEVASTLKQWISENADQTWLTQHEKQWGSRKKGSSAAENVPSAANLLSVTGPPTTDEFSDFLTMIGKETDSSSGFSVADSVIRRGKPDSPDSKFGPDSQSVLVGNSGIKKPATGSPRKSHLHPTKPASATLRQADATPPAWTMATPPQTEQSDSAGTATPPAAAPVSLASAAPAVPTTAAPSQGQEQAPKRPAQPQKKNSWASNLSARLNQLRKQPILAGVLLVAVLTVVGGIVFWLSRGGESPAPAVVVPGAQESVPVSPGGTASPVRKLGPEITVGPTGNFPTLQAAIDHLLQHSDPSTISEPRKILIQPEVILSAPLRILDPPSAFPKNLQILGVSEAPIVWNGTGKEPLVHLTNVEGLQLINFQMNAAGAETAIQLEGHCHGSTIRGCSLRGFTSAGIRLIGTAGLLQSPCRIEDTTFQSEHSGARGISITSGLANAESLAITRCRFLGPLEAGIECSADVLRWGTIRESIFHQLQTGIRFTAPEPLLGYLLIANNTFHECHLGISWQTLPSDRSNDLDLARNLFIDSRQADMQVEQTFSPEQLQQILATGQTRASFNWTTRPVPETPPAVNIFTHEGRFGVEDWKFESVETSAANFLKPAAGAGRLPAAENFKPFVGAVAP